MAFFPTGRNFHLPNGGGGGGLIGVDHSGDIYMFYGAGAIREYSPEGALLLEISTTVGTADKDADVNPMTDELWLATSEYVYQFSPDGMLVDQYPSPSGGRAAITAGGPAGNVYVGSNSGSGYTGSDGIDIMTPGTTVTLPDASVERPENAPTGFHAADVTLHGTVDPTTSTLTIVISPTARNLDH